MLCHSEAWEGKLSWGYVQDVCRLEGVYTTCNTEPWSTLVCLLIKITDIKKSDELKQLQNSVNGAEAVDSSLNSVQAELWTLSHHTTHPLHPPTQSATQCCIDVQEWNNYLTVLQLSSTQETKDKCGPLAPPTPPPSPLSLPSCLGMSLLQLATRQHKHRVDLYISQGDVTLVSWSINAQLWRLGVHHP